MHNVSTVNIADISVSLFDSIEQATHHIINNDGDVMYGNAIAINPEKIIAAHDSPKLKLNLQQATFTYADGIGVVKLLEKRSGKKRM